MNSQRLELNKENKFEFLQYCYCRIQSCDFIEKNNTCSIDKRRERKKLYVQVSASEHIMVHVVFHYVLRKLNKCYVPRHAMNALSSIELRFRIIYGHLFLSMHIGLY